MTRVEEFGAGVNLRESIDHYIKKVLGLIEEQGEEVFQDEIIFFPKKPHPILGERYHPVAGPLFLKMFGDIKKKK